MKRLYPLAVVFVVLAFVSAPATAGGAATFPDGTALVQSGAAFLCMPGQPDIAQDQTSGIYEVGGELYSVGDDSGQIFRFGLDAPYMDFCDGIRVPRWRPNMDLEELTYIPEIDEFVVSFEYWDTKVQLLTSTRVSISMYRPSLLPLTVVFAMVTLAFVRTMRPSRL